MSKQHIHVGVEDARHGLERFVDAWHRGVAGEIEREEIHLNFEDFAMLASVLTPKRLDLLRTLRRHGPSSVRALSKLLGRDYKNVHTDARTLEQANLIQRTEKGLLISPWDVIDTHVRLVA